MQSLFLFALGLVSPFQAASVPATSPVDIPMASSAVLVPFEKLHIISPELQHHFRQNFLDPFDVSNADMCWKRRACSSSDSTLDSPDRDQESSSFRDTDHPFDFDPLAFAALKTTCGWKACPANMSFSCGLGCAVSRGACAMDIFHEITSVLEVGFNIGMIVLAATSGGLSTLLQAAGHNLGHWLEEAGEHVAAEAIAHIIAAKIGKEAADQLAKQIIGAASSAGLNVTIDWTIADPTGVSAVIQNFWKPICP